MKKITIIGGGSWGTALGKVLASKEIEVSLLVRREVVCDSINKEKENPFYLPGIKLPKKLKATLDLEEAFGNSEAVFWVIPSHTLRQMLEGLKPLAERVKYHVSAIKGIDLETQKTPYHILREGLPDGCEVMVLGGPSFAKEVAKELPTAVVLAGEKEDETKKIQELIAQPYFRVYRSEDPIGVEIAGALKNVIAIASGICDGLQLGLNARASLITRGLIEMIRLGTKLGGKLHTFYGLAGLGDLVLTCTGALSRNYQVGYRIGKGEKLEDILKSLREVAEGVKTSKVVKNLAYKLKVEMPICEEVYQVLFEKESPQKCLKRLLSRGLKKEFEGCLVL
ncbi:NAD(P)-dependent glycerol-3-phosphate dehydrogenase [Thermodesulfobacterium sp. TA1]|uniref:NAD(P)H-dependent glycerol-3-phosphate dehydrogenase n=1 Tax=Thermodesulfobacterium sp. TA1 TaxID=2234087 RepID=UPI001232B28C|nr:NAD(P)H-dependent glycerol-3-phosphate dehydrogenase [Thermodesulfobacterium sp. TA1]QER41832.1 NAD(P)-dependent glycerol-3-phosphate dehydrogenase [Thermodesulfobacterium sp. TA1]